MKLSSAALATFMIASSVAEDTSAAPWRIITTPNGADWCETPRPSREVTDEAEIHEIAEDIQRSIEAYSNGSEQPDNDGESFDACVWRYTQVDFPQCEDLFDDSFKPPKPQPHLVTTTYNDNRIFQDFTCLRTGKDRRLGRNTCMADAQRDLKNCIIEASAKRKYTSDTHECEEFSARSARYCDELDDYIDEMGDAAFKSRVHRAQKVCRDSYQKAREYCINPKKELPKLRTEHHAPVPPPPSEPPPEENVPPVEIKVPEGQIPGQDLI